MATGVALALHLAAAVVVLVLLLRSAGRGDPGQRSSRRFLAASVAAVVVAWVVSLGYVVLSGSVPVPSLADAAAALWVPLAVVGLWRIPSRGAEGVMTQRLVADIAVVASTLLYASWLLVLQPITAVGALGSVGRGVELYFPITDLVVAIVVLSLVTRVRVDQQYFMVFAAAGLLLVAAADSATAVHVARQGSAAFGWTSVLLQCGFALLAYSAWEQRVVSLESYARIAKLYRSVPVFAPVFGLLVGVQDLLRGGRIGAVQIGLGTAIVVALVLRQLVYIRELTLVAEGHRRAAVHDPLTGLPNRKAFLEALAARVDEADRGQAAVVIMDLDGFKAVNDTFGHDRGDEVLVDFAGVLERAAGPYLAARLGGDEFALLVTHPDGGRNAADRATVIATEVVRNVLPHAGGLAVTCSVGLTVLRPGDTVGAALRRADLAMFWAKRRADVRVALFEESMAEEADRRSLLLAQLRGSAGRGELALVFQPLYRLESGEVAAAEALLRWQHPVFGEVSPGEFVPLAEESGDIREIGAWVLETAVAQVAAWRRCGRLLPRVLVNVSAWQFTDDLPGDIATLLARYEVPARQLVLEITESQLPGLVANEAVARLRAAGVRIAMDDFGSGYSSLAQLARLPVDLLKVDKELIDNLSEASGRCVLDAVVALARSLGLETVAEGIEQDWQAAEVAAAGVDYGQGYLFARPLTAEQLLARLAGPRVVAPRGAERMLPSAVD